LAVRPIPQLLSEAKSALGGFTIRYLLPFDIHYVLLFKSVSAIIVPMGRRLIIFTIIAVTAQALYAAVPPPASATCHITCTVANIAEWSDTQFSDVDLGQLTQNNKLSTGRSTLTLYTNGDVTIIADNNPSAQLSFDRNSLQTSYKLQYDGSGSGSSGGQSTQWQPFDSFLAGGAQVTHVSADGAVEVTLSIQAAVDNVSPDNAGSYDATQTLTLCWKS
jgi:hypothetical protein